MSSLSIAYVNTARTLASISQQRATGELQLGTDKQAWRLYFFHGRLVYATGNLHQVRRWRRAMKQQCPDYVPDMMPSGELWEYQLLSQSVAQNQLSMQQAQGVIKISLEEVLFAWVSNPALAAEWSAVQRFVLKDNSALGLLLSSTDVEGVLQRSRQLWKSWKLLELESLNPYRSPVLKTISSEVSNAATLPVNLRPFLTGRYTLWDIACYARRPVTTITRFLLPWVQRGAIALEEVADLPHPFTRLPNTVKSQGVRPLIACVDDSPTVGQFLANILEPAGYRVVKIQEPLSGIGILSKTKPDLIFLDLVMPNANGYDLCAFLRKTPIFQNTPIIVLTSQSSFIDRTRAKLAGASDFLTKPPEPQALLSLVRQHLQSVMSDPKVVSCKCWEE
jgi:two-component system, chemotaxis family, response regulator PixG